MKRRSLLLWLGVLASPPTLAFPNLAFGDEGPLLFDRFSVVVQGTGPDLVLVHGLNCSRAVWGDVVARLGGRYRLHLVQVAGLGGEPVRGNAQGAICAGVADGLAEYIATKKLASPVIVGHSMGGFIALMLAARHPAAVGRIMVVDMFPSMAPIFVGPQASPEQVRSTADEIAAKMAHADPASRRKSIEHTLDGMILTASARPAVAQQGMASDPGVSSRAMRELIVTDLTPELPRITAPTTVLYAWNKNDPYTAAQADQLYQSSYAGLKGVKLVRIDDTAHFIFIDQPDRFQAALDMFLSS